MYKIKRALDEEIKKRDRADEITLDRPDPLLVASKYKDEYISLVCALFAYGNANQIVKFLSSLDFSLLDGDEKEIKESFYYRFQTKEDVKEFFITLNRAKRASPLKEIFLRGYKKREDVMDGLRECISFLYDLNSYRSQGYKFLIGKLPGKMIKSPYKRWHMFLRWMVRDEGQDFGLWREVNKKDLLIPLDTHTFKVSQKLGLLKRKSYDFKSVLLLTQKLKEFDPNDPVKYDFALYRIGQEKITLNPNS